MKKIVAALLLFACLLASAQSKYTAEQVEQSTDPKVLANFIKYNPEHPKTPLFKQKLYSILMKDNDVVPKPTVKPLKTSALKADVKADVRKGTVDAHTQKTVDLLNHLFSNDPHRPEAYVQIENKSKCNMVVKISGRKFYNLDVKAGDQNFILVDKGTYTLTTNVCDAKYSSVKNIDKDIVITLKSGIR